MVSPRDSGMFVDRDMGFHHGLNETDDHRDRHAEAGRRSAARRGERSDRGGLRDDPNGVGVLRSFDGAGQRTRTRASLACGSCSSARARRRRRRCSAAARIRSLRRQARRKRQRTATWKATPPPRRKAARKRRHQGTAATGPTPTPGRRRSWCLTNRLQPGDPCPKCDKGTVYETGRPGVLVRLVGQAPIQAKIYELQKLRCNLCGVVFTAQPPDGRRRGEVRRDGRQHDRAAEIRQRDALQPRGEAAREHGHSLAGLDPMGHRPREGRKDRAGLRGIDPPSGPRRSGS